MAAKLKAQKILDKIKELNQELIDHQEQCKHPSDKVTATYGSNVGNYDPTCDVRWTDYKCGICLKLWTIYK